MDDKFEQLFDRLVNVISNSDSNDHDLINVIDQIINYFNKVMKKTFKINYVTKKDVMKTGDMSFMYTTDNVINYSVEVIREIQNKLKTFKTENYNPDYNDVTYCMFLIDTIGHELCHCSQYEDNINGILTEQTYLNSLCYAINHNGKINYLDKSYEGEAYGSGVLTMKKLCCNMCKLHYVDTYGKQMVGWNFFKKNVLFHEAIYHLNKIPFMNTKRGFEDIIIYITYNLTLLSKQNRDSLIKRYPLIVIGLEEKNNECHIKNVDELMGQYFGRYIKYGVNKSFLNQKELDTLIDIYIFLLMPQLTVKNYNALCMKYGEQRMDSFMKTLKENIDKKISIYDSAYRRSFNLISLIRITDKDILQNVDKTYATNKYKTAIIYLNDYNRRIDNLIGNSKKNHM